MSHLSHNTHLISPAISCIPKHLPLISDKPSLQVLFNLPPPPPGLPRLPPRQPRPFVPPTAPPPSSTPEPRLLAPTPPPPLSSNVTTFTPVSDHNTSSPPSQPPSPTQQTPASNTCISEPCLTSPPTPASNRTLAEPAVGLPSLNLNTSPISNINTIETPTTVINLSNRTLNSDEASLLSKGLSFSPTPHFDHFRLVSDVLLFAKSLRWKYYFINNPPTNPTPFNQIHPSLTKFKPHSPHEPPPLPSTHPLEVYINSLLDKVSNYNLPNLLNHSRNLTFKERQALKNLKTDNSIVILPADKGSSTVILNSNDYFSEAYSQLSCTDTYRLLQTDPTLQFNNTISSYLVSQGPLEGLSESDIKILTPENPRTPHLYLLPKVHKKDLSSNLCPGRPILAGYGCHTERISAFVDSYLQPFSQSLSSLTKDTNHFLDLIRDIPTPLPDNIYLVTVDVSSLYTNIPHTEGVEALKYYLDERPKPQFPSTSFLLQLMEFVLEMNNFRFEDKHYLQIKGTAMGTRAAPSYANLFMGRVETLFLQSQSLQPLMWRRFIDDIFFLWSHGLPALEKFLSDLNSFSCLRFTSEYSQFHVTFLDVDVYLQGGRLETAVHIKPSNLQQYLHFSSCHPHSQKKSIPFSLGIRGNRICSNEAFLDRYIVSIRTSLLSRGYPTSIVNSQISASLHPRPVRPPASPSFYLFTSYYPGLQILNKFLKDGFVTLSSNPTTCNLLSKSPAVTFRRPPNLRNLLVHTKPPSTSEQPLPHGTHPCNRNRCLTCPILDPSTTFTSPSTNISYQIPSSSTCTSSNVVYCLECRQCDCFYVGETSTSFNLRINNHRKSCRDNRSDLPVAVHAQSHQTSSFNDLYKARILRRLPEETSTPVRRNWEIAHQLVLKSRLPPGINKQ